MQEAIDSDEIQSDKFDKLVLRDPDSKFWMFYTNQGAERKSKLLRDRMQCHSLKVTCLVQEQYDIAMAHTSRFCIVVIAYLGR